MIDLQRVEKKLLEFEAFFELVLKNPMQIDNTSYGAGSDYGLKSIKNMKGILKEYREKPQNKYLKQLFAGFTSVSRGVEGFNEYHLNEQFREVCKGVYQIQEDLNSHISW